MKNGKKDTDRNAELPVTVTATINAIPFMEGLVKYLAQRRYNVSFQLLLTHPGWEAIDTSSVETFVSGNFHFDSNNNPLKVTFGSGFLFTCIRGHEGVYELRWSNSLS
jgi:hypothetical protein